jgi:hypothetical protein
MIMRENFELHKDQFLDFVDKWEKAQTEKIFDDIPKPRGTSAQTSDVSFFGAMNSNPTSSLDNSDVAYWDAIYQSSIDNLASNDNNVLNEENNQYPPNPMPVDTGGIDQEMEPRQLGLTFDEEDLKKLEDMKLNLHDLESKVAEMNDEKSEKIQLKIKQLKSKIDELSTDMGYSAPNDIA